MIPTEACEVLAWIICSPRDDRCVELRAIEAFLTIILVGIAIAVTPT